MAEYAAAYGGFPRPDDPWPLFMAGVGHSFRFPARRELHVLDGVSAAIGAAFGGGPAAQGEREVLRQAAYPTRERGPKLVTNLANPEHRNGDGR